MARTVIWRKGATGLPVYKDWRGIGIAGEPKAGAEDSTISGSLVVATDGEVATILAEHAGDVEVVIDGSLVAGLVTMTPGVTWSAPNAGVLRLSTPDAGTILDITGAFVGNVTKIENLTVQAAVGVQPVLSLSHTAQLRNVTIKNKTGSGGPMVAFADQTFTVIETDTALTLDNSLTVAQPIFKVGTSAVGADAAGVTILSRGVLALAGTNPITSPNTSAALAVKTDANVAVGYVATKVSRAFSGTATQTYYDDVSGLTYTPAVVANWNNSAPANVAAALDRIAAKITPVT